VTGETRPVPRQGIPPGEATDHMHGSDDVEGHEFLDLFLFPVVTSLSLLSGRTAGAAEVAKERPQPGDNAHRVILRGRRVIKITWSGKGSRGCFPSGQPVKKPAGSSRCRSETGSGQRLTFRSPGGFSSGSAKEEDLPCLPGAIAGIAGRGNAVPVRELVPGDDDIARVVPEVIPGLFCATGGCNLHIRPAPGVFLEKIEKRPVGIHHEYREHRGVSWQGMLKVGWEGGFFNTVWQEVSAFYPRFLP